MIRFVDLTRFEETFATMLSSFHVDAGLSLDHISQKIIETDYFDFLEKNDWDAFDAYCARPYQAMLKDLFRFDFNRELSFEKGAVYWAGLTYMKAFLNYRIPLKQLFLLCPLQQMVRYFDPYHEMNFLRICEKLLHEDCRQSILKSLRKGRKITVPQLSFLTGISKATLLYYELDNDHLFKASSDNVLTLARILKTNPSIFYRRSFFNPISRFLLRDPEYANSLLAMLCAYYGLTQSEGLAVHIYDEGDGDGLYIGQRNLLVVGHKAISVPDTVMEGLVYQQALSIPSKTELLY